MRKNVANHMSGVSDNRLALIRKGNSQFVFITAQVFMQGLLTFMHLMKHKDIHLNAQTYYLKILVVFAW